MNKLDIFAPFKKKYSRGNMTLMNKSLTRTHMKRSRLRSLNLKNKVDTSRIAYIKQSNYRVSLLRKTKQGHYSNLNKKYVAANKQFGKTVKLLLPIK